MFCRKCGVKIPKDSSFCFHCGAKIQTDSKIQGKINRTPPPAVSVNGIQRPAAAKQAAPKDRATRNAITVLSIMGGFTVLCFIIVMIAAIFLLLSQTAPATAGYGAGSIVEGDDIGNTPANNLCDGIAAMQDDTIYFMKSSIYENEEFLTAMDFNDNKEQILLTFYGSITNINVIGDQLFFIGDMYTEDYDIENSGIYVYDLTNDIVTEIYSTDHCVMSLYAFADQIYFRVSDEEGSDQILSANLDGSNVQTVIEKDDYLYGLGIFGDYFYYDYLDTLCRADLDGENDTAIYASSDTLNTYCVAGSRLYVADTPAASGTVIKAMDLDGKNEKEILGFSPDEWVLYLNVVDEKIYYAVETLNEKDEVINCKICSMNQDGSAKQTIVSTDSEIFGLSICGKWLFYYNNDKGKTIKVNLNKVAENVV